MERETLIVITLIGYNALLILIGFWASRRTHDNDDFFLGGRGLGPLVASVSYAASSSSAWALIGFTGMVYTIGASGIWFIPGLVLGHYVSWTYIAPRLMSLSKTKSYLTVTDVLAGEAKGGTRSAIVVFASLFIVLSFAFYVAAQFDASAKTFAANFDITFEYAVMLGASIILIYTLLGGFWAVSVTDTLQGLLMATVALFLPIAALIATGGPSGFWQAFTQMVTPEQLSFTGQAGVIAFIGFLVGVIALAIGAFGQPHLLTRFMALRDDKALKQGRIIALIWFTVIFTSMYIVGLSGHILLDGLGGDSESLFFALTAKLLPGIIAGIVTAAILSAIMSTADSQLLVAASAIAHDLGFERRFGISPIIISRITIALLCVASVLVTLYLPESIFSRVVFAWSALGAAFGPTVLGRAFGFNSTPTGVLTAMVLGFSLTVYFHFFPVQPADIFERVIPFVLGISIIFATSKREN